MDRRLITSFTFMTVGMCKMVLSNAIYDAILCNKR